MAEYIEKRKVIERFQKIKKSGVSLRDAAYLDGVMAVLDAFQPEDVAPVVHAEWIKRSFISADVFCSECHTLETTKDSNYKSKYCPHCGAKMDGGAEDE